MFKNTDDEAVFNKILSTYAAEFGPQSLLIYLPRRVADVLDRQNLTPLMRVRFWKKNAYQIRVEGTTAAYTLTPDD